MPINDFNYNNESQKSDYSISNDALEWIGKIDSLCKDKNVNFYLVSPPLPKYIKHASKNWKLFKQKTANTKHKQLFNVYFNSFIYYDDKYARDNIHMKTEFANSNNEKFLNFMRKTIKLKE